MDFFMLFVFYSLLKRPFCVLLYKMQYFLTLQITDMDFCA